jgi:hypothetical protein
VSSEDEAKVRRGIALLDQYFKNMGRDWRGDIEPDLLDFGSDENSILGQLFGDFDEAATMLSGHCDMDDRQRHQWADEHGFVASGSIEDEPNPIKEAWLAQINQYWVD